MDWLYQKLLSLFVGSGSFQKLVRKALAFLSGYLLSVPGLAPDVVANFIGSSADLIVALVPAALSLAFSKLSNKKK